jgi:ankyrin repeat protein
MKYVSLTIFLLSICVTLLAFAGPNEDLIAAAEKGDIATVQALLAKGVDVNAKDKDGRTALMLASWKGQVEVVKELLAKSADANAKDNYGGTALMFAAQEDHTETVQALLSKGADVNAADKEGNTPLHYAAATGNLVITNWVGPYLFEAVTHGNKTTIDLLLANGANVNAKSKDGYTPLHRASVDGDKDVVELLLTHGANVNATTNDGMTPLHCVVTSDWKMEKDGSKIVIKGATDLAQLLLNKGANVNTKDKNGVTALTIATKNGHKEIIELLKKAGAKE